MQIGSGGQGHFLTQGYEAGIRSQHTLAFRCQGPDDLCVSSLSGPGGSDRKGEDGNLHWTGGGSANLPCEAVLGVSGVAWARGEAVVQVSTQRKAIQASHSIGLSEWLSSQLLWMGRATAAMMMAGLIREQNVTFWRMEQCSGGLISQGIGDDQAEGISQDGLVLLQIHILIHFDLSLPCSFLSAHLLLSPVYITRDMGKSN